MLARSPFCSGVFTRRSIDEQNAMPRQNSTNRLDIFHNYICITAIGAAGIGWRGEATARPVVGGSGTRLTARMTMAGDSDASLCSPETGGSWRRPAIVSNSSDYRSDSRSVRVDGRTDGRTSRMSWQTVLRRRTCLTWRQTPDNIRSGRDETGRVRVMRLNALSAANADVAGSAVD